MMEQAAAWCGDRVDEFDDKFVDGWIAAGVSRDRQAWPGARRNQRVMDVGFGHGRENRYGA